jgi:hypothetical protein
MQTGAHGRVVRHRGKQPAIGAAAPSAAGSTIVGRFMRIVEAGGPVTENDDERGEAIAEAGRTEHAGNAINFLDGGEAAEQLSGPAVV